MRILIALGCLAISAGCASVKPTAGPGRPFDFQRDTFAYANELVFNYQNGVHVAETNAPGRERSYTRRCFIMAAGAVQFWKHARFDSSAPPVSGDELARRIRQVRNRAAWWPSEPAKRRVAFPGFTGLHDLSAREGRLVRANMGAGWTTYFHLRKFPMPFRPSPEYEARLCDELQRWLLQGHPMVVWLYNFPDVNINHAVTVFEETGRPQPDQIAFRVYDPNYTDAPRTLTYDTVTRTFSYGKTFYFPGGPVHVRYMYTSLLR
jgi:hypothetical protein